MKPWLKLSLFLCIFGILKEMQPSEPFYFENLTGVSWNITAESVQREVVPIGTYTNLVILVVMILLTDLLRYKPLIILQAVAGVICWGLVLWGRTLVQLQISYVFYGTFLASEVAYFTYIYAKIPKKYYTRVTSQTRAALIFGHGVSAALSQILVSLQLLDYQQLNYITFSAMVCAVLWALILPSVKTSIYFYSQDYEAISTSKRYINAFKLMKHHFVQSYSQIYVCKWSLWWALTNSAFIYIQLYIQPLWSTIIQGTDAKLYNATVETVMTIVSFSAALSVGYLKVDWRKYGEVTLALCSSLSSALLILSSQTVNLSVSYLCYITYGLLYYFALTIATSEVAKHILEDSYGLVFGFNTFIALFLQTIMMLVFVSGDIGWTLNPRQQHLAYGVYYAAIAVIFILNAIFKCIWGCRIRKA